MFSSDKFEAQYKESAAKLAKDGHGPSDGIVCVHATLKYIASVIDPKKPFADQVAQLYKECFEAKTLSGFASNASAAAKACKLATSAKEAAFSGF